MFAIGEVDVKGLQRFENMLGALGTDGPKAANRAINRTGDMARTQVVRALAKQTGLPQKTVRKAIRVKRSSWDNLNYTMTAGGGDIALRFFKIRETLKGVSADLGTARGRVLFEGAFFRGGRFPSRVDLDVGGSNVFERRGDARLPIDRVRSGIFIGAEMVDGESAEAFEKSVERNLPVRLDHEIGRLLGL